jgi:hypothetical protein
MQQLSGKQIGEIQEALLDAFPARDDLRMMVRIELDEKLEAIADGSNQRVVIFNLISWAERTGRIDDLVQGALRQNQGNLALQKLMASWRAAAPPAAGHDASRSAAPATSGPVSIDLFLSYSRKNLPAMRIAKESLRAAGLAVWTDEGLEPGTESWTAAIQAAIAQALAMVVLLSPEAKASRWVEREFTYAQTLGKRVFPVLIAGDESSAVPISLITAQWVDGRQDLRQALRQDLQPALLRYLTGFQLARSAAAADETWTEDRESAHQKFEQFRLLVRSLNLDSAISKQGKLEEYARSVCFSGHQHAAISDLIAIGSGQTLPEATRIQVLLGEYLELTIAAAAARPTDNPSVEHRDMMKDILRSSQFPALKGTNSELYDRFLQAVRRVEQVSQCMQQEWAVADVTQYADPQGQFLRAYLSCLDPFSITWAEREHFGIWCELDAFWPDHPVNSLISRATGAWVIDGEIGSGKTAIARADRARLVKNRASLDGLWVRVTGHADLRTILGRIAQNLLDFIVEYPCYWGNLRVAQQRWLMHFWLSSLGREAVLRKTAFVVRQPDDAPADAERSALESTARSVERSFERAPLPQAWIDSVFSMANAVGFRQVRLFLDDIDLDDIDRQPTDREAEQLMRLAEAHVDVFVLTERPEVTAVLERHGFRTVRFAWTPAQLWQMAFYRLSAFSRHAEARNPATTSSIGPLLNPNRPLHEWRDELPIQAVFTREGWAAAIALSEIRTPRVMFHFWHALLQLPAAIGQIEKIDAAGVRSAWETVQSHDT